MRLSIVMPTYNRPDALPRALDALDGQSLQEFELVLVEDADNSALPDIGPRRYPVRTLRGERAGASSARNAGWRAAEAPLVLFMGDDILAGRDMVEQHLLWHDRHPEDGVGVLGAVRWAREVRRTAFLEWLDRGIQFDYGSIAGVDAGPGHFYTANVSLKRSMLERTGGFDEDRFPFLYEDIDLGVRLFDEGFRLLYNSDARAEHLHEPTLEDWRRRMARVAAAERNWVDRHPDQAPYFHDRFADALAQPPLRGRAARIARWVPRDTPVLGPRVWRNADLWFRQQLGPAFMEAWDSRR